MKDSERPTLYVGCALTDAPEDFRHKVEELKRELETEWDVLHFLGLEGGTDTDVYQHDIGNVLSCMAFLAIADHPSTGLGVEIGRADAAHKPTLIVAHEVAKITRLLLGAADVQNPITFRRYKDFGEIPALAHEVLRPMILLDKEQEGVHDETISRSS